MARFRHTARVLRQAAARGAFPGAVISVIDEGMARYTSRVGNLGLVPERSRNSLTTVYDLASLTKALCTTTLTILAVARGALHLDTRVGTLLPEFTGRGKRPVRVWHLLTHSSGLPAHRPYYEEHRGRDVIVANAAGEPLVYAPGTRSVYSDLGYLILGAILERVYGARIDDLFRDMVARPLDLSATRFVDLTRPATRRSFLRTHEVAPTQVRRGRPRRGAVDDDNAFAMGGVAPHAGLFGPVQEVATIGLALCGAWHHGTTFSRELVRRFFRPAGVPDSTWGLGWDTPAPTGSSVGTRFPRDAVGHLGYTGCSLWLAPKRGLVVALLTNRVHPSADNTAIRDVRPAVHDAVMADLDG